MTKAELTAENRPAWECVSTLYDTVMSKAKTHEDQGGVEILVVLLHVLGVVFHCLSFVHGVEIKLGVVVLDRLEVHPEGFLDAVARSQFVGLLHL